MIELQEEGGGGGGDDFSIESNDIWKIESIWMNSSKKMAFDY